MDNTTMAERDAARELIRADAIKRMQLLSQIEDIATTTTIAGPWVVRKIAGEYYEVSGRGSMMVVHLKSTISGILLSIPSHNRCGYVPATCQARDLMDYCDFRNKADANTLAAAVRYLATNNMID